MAETEAKGTSDTSRSKAPEKTEVEVNAPNSRVVINTAEDAAMAFLHGQISEDELKDCAARFGVQPGELMLAPDRLERPDDAFEKTLPDDIYKPSREHLPDYKERLEKADEKQKEREDATKKAEKATGDVQKVEVVPAGASTSPSASAQDKANESTSSSSSSTPTKSTASSTKDK